MVRSLGCRGREALDVVSKRQWGNILDGTGCQYLPYRICKFQRYRHSVAKNTGVVIEFGEGKNVLQDHVDVRLAFINVDDQRIGNLPPWVGLNARRPAACPEMGAALAADVCKPAQHRILAFAVELQVPFLPD